MADLSDFLKYIWPYVTGAAEPRVENAIRDALDELCTKSCWYQANLSAVALVADQSQYTIAAPANTRIVKPMAAAIGDGSTQYWDMGPPTTQEEMDFLHPGWPIASSQRTPYRWWRSAPTAVDVWPAPNAEAVTDSLALRVRAALAPAVTGTTIDDRFLSDAREAVRYGALSRLYEDNEKYANAQKAKDNRTRFRDAIAEFTVRAQMGDGRRSISMSQPGLTPSSGGGRSDPLFGDTHPYRGV